MIGLLFHETLQRFTLDQKVVGPYCFFSFFKKSKEFFVVKGELFGGCLRYFFDTVGYDVVTDISALI